MALQRPTNKKWQWIMAMVVACLLAVGAGWILTRPTVFPSVNFSTATLNWPAFGQAAVGIVNSSALETHGAQTPVPTASTAKLITALMALNAKPLMLRQTGPMITMSSNDIHLMNAYAARNGSEISMVLVGEQLSEYQMLEAMLLPSANNMADSLAIWAYGSLPEYSAAANKFLARHGLNDTHVGPDASGFNPSTVSTAQDMVRIGKLVMQNPVLAEIVAKKSVSGFPLVGAITNTNNLLGQNGIVGIKTGHSDEAGGAYVAAARVIVNGQTATVVTAVLAAPSIEDAKAASLTLLKSMEANNIKPNVQGGYSRGVDLCRGTGGIGHIISAEKNTITIKRKDGRTQIVNLAGQTTIKTPAGSASQSDLKIGDAVTLVGGPNSDGSFTANTVVVCGGISPKTQSGWADVSSKPDSTEPNSVPPGQLRRR